LYAATSFAPVQGGDATVPPPATVCTITINTSYNPWETAGWSGGDTEVCVKLYCDWFAGSRWVCITYTPNTMTPSEMAVALRAKILDELQWCELLQSTDITVADNTVIIRGPSVPSIPCGPPEAPTEDGSRSNVLLTTMKYAE
jgi:hypothetical protein